MKSKKRESNEWDDKQDFIYAFFIELMNSVDMDLSDKAEAMLRFLKCFNAYEDIEK